MIAALSLDVIAESTGGQPTDNVSFKSVSTDTRTINAGDLFVALCGENFNGTAFVKQAANAGAVAAVVNHLVAVDVPQLVVDDTQKALGLIARANRRSFSGPVIAMTGSAGKTTVKEMVASILRESGRVLATQGNFNNEIGVPLTLLNINDQHQFAVIEMGAAKQGDIRYLTQFAEPTIAVLTNVLPAHLDGFGDVENIAKTKGEIFERLGENHIAIMNIDEPYVEQWLQQASPAQVVSFAKENSEADFFASNIHILESGVTAFDLCAQHAGISINLPLLGEHNVTNALAAAAAATAAGASLQQIKNGLENVQAAAGRLDVVQTKNHIVIDDSYNANPESVKAAIDVLMTFSGEKCLVLGTLAELAESARHWHQVVAQYARDKGVQQLWVVGEYAQLQADVFGENAFAYTSMEQLLASLKHKKLARVVLVKGSRSAKMEQVVKALIADNGGAQ